MKEIDLEDMDEIDLDEIEKKLNLDSEDDEQNQDPPETELEYKDRLITPSDKVKNIPTISRELVTTNFDSKTANIARHYDKVQIKYEILKYCQLHRINDFEEAIKAKLERAKRYGFKLKVLRRDYVGIDVDYTRVIHFLASVGKSVDGFNVKTNNTEFKKSSEDIQNLEINREEQYRRRKLTPW
jgi:hypothetical protein